jgi:hypothetical protein
MESLVKRNFRSELKRIDWDFTGENGSDGFAAYHWYPARFVPQLPGILINYFSNPGDKVLDPFCGSCTTIVEAFRFGRKAVGIDINPIAILIGKVKFTGYDEGSFSRFRETIRAAIIARFQSSAPLLPGSKALSFQIPNESENRQWYHIDTLNQLGAIWTVLHQHTRSKYFEVGLAAFSSILRYSCSQEKHWGWICDNVKPRRLIHKNAIHRFHQKLLEFAESAKRLHRDATLLQEHKILRSDIELLHGDSVELLKGFPSEKMKPLKGCRVPKDDEEQFALCQ